MATFNGLLADTTVLIPASSPTATTVTPA